MLWLEHGNVWLVDIIRIYELRDPRTPSKILRLSCDIIGKSENHKKNVVFLCLFGNCWLKVHVHRQFSKTRTAQTIRIHILLHSGLVNKKHQLPGKPKGVHLYDFRGQWKCQGSPRHISLDFGFIKSLKIVQERSTDIHGQSYFSKIQTSAQPD